MIITRTAAAIAAVGTAVALSGCGIIGDKIEEGVGNVVEEGVEKAIEQGAGGDVDIEVGNNVDLPSGFPDGLPLPDGDPIAAYGSPDGWSVNYTSSDADAAESLKDEYLADGWTLENEQNLGGALQSYLVRSDDYTVLISQIGEDGEYTIGLIVNPAQSE